MQSPAVVGWLTATGRSGSWWPGVLLHRDAFLVKAPREVLVKGPGLCVVIEADRAQLQIERSKGAEPSPVDTVKVLEIDGWPDDPATAMVRLATAFAVDVSTEVNRAGFEIAVQVTGSAWAAFESLGLIPDGLDRRRPPGLAAHTPPLIPVGPAPTRPTPSVETVSVEPAGWCDIFWWLC